MMQLQSLNLFQAFTIRQETEEEEKQTIFQNQDFTSIFCQEAAHTFTSVWKLRGNINPVRLSS